MKKTIIILFVFTVGLLMLWATSVQASIMFSFEESGGTVVMTSSGTLDTTKLLYKSGAGIWGGAGIWDNDPGDIDIMGGVFSGTVVDTSFTFNAGTDYSAILNPGGPFSLAHYSVESITGSKSFTTYSGRGVTQRPGISMVGSDIVSGLWTPDQTWTYSDGQTFASLGLNTGTYTVSDFLTSEAITIQVGNAPVVPEPISSTLFLIGGAVMGFRRFRKK